MIKWMLKRAVFDLVGDKDKRICNFIVVLMNYNLFTFSKVIFKILR